jgi:hypothetical protein
MQLYLHEITLPSTFSHHMGPISKGGKYRSHSILSKLHRRRRLHLSASVREGLGLIPPPPRPARTGRAARTLPHTCLRVQVQTLPSLSSVRHVDLLVRGMAGWSSGDGL